MVDRRADVVLKHVLPMIEERVRNQSSGNQYHPFVLGVTGLQGSGKSYLASALTHILRERYKYNAIETSIDDFYLPHNERELLRSHNPANKLLSVRGQPGTHDVQLATEFFDQFQQPEQREIWLPSFDKGLFNGDGDRLPRPQWKTVKGPVDVLVFEGWCLGFRPLGNEQIEKKHSEAIETRHSVAEKLRESQAPDFSTSTLADHDLAHLRWINEQLDLYCKRFTGPQNFDFLVHLDTDDLASVYTWRMQQERALMESKGSAMTDEQVVKFVQAYMPAYELYLDGLRRSYFDGSRLEGKKAHMRLVMNIDRTVSYVREL